MPLVVVTRMQTADLRRMRQALALTGDPANADPVCTLSPFRHVIDEALHEHAGAEAYVYRNFAVEPR